MGHLGGGSNNISANGRTVGWQKVKRIKARVVKKRVGAKEKHAALVKATSGARTKKHQRKVERRKRLNDKETAALEAAMEVEAPAPAKAKKALKKAAAGKKAKKAAAAPEAMQD